MLQNMAVSSSTSAASVHAARFTHLHARKNREHAARAAYAQVCVHTQYRLRNNHALVLNSLRMALGTCTPYHNSVHPGGHSRQQLTVAMYTGCRCEKVLLNLVLVHAARAPFTLHDAARALLRPSA